MIQAMKNLKKNIVCHRQSNIKKVNTMKTILLNWRQKVLTQVCAIIQLFYFSYRRYFSKYKKC